MLSLATLVLLGPSALAAGPEGFPGAKVSFQQMSADGMSCQLVATNQRTCTGTFPASLLGVAATMTVTMLGADLNALEIWDAKLVLDLVISEQNDGVVKARTLKSALSDMYKAAGCSLAGVEPSTNAMIMADGSDPSVVYDVNGTWSSKTHKITLTVKKRIEGE